MIKNKFTVMEIIDVVPDGLDEPSPNSSNDDERTVKELVLFLKSDDNIIRIFSGPPRKYKCNQKQIKQLLIGKTVKIILGFVNSDSNNYLIMNGKKNISQKGGKDNFIEGIILDIDVEENIDINGIRYNIFRSLIDCGLPIYVNLKYPVKVGEYHHLSGTILPRKIQYILK